MEPTKGVLENAIFSLIDALKDPEAKERDFQKIFEEHPDILYSLGYSDFLDEPRMYDPVEDEKFFPDFIAKRTSDQCIEIIDLKLPDLNLGLVEKNGRRKRLRAEIGNYRAQVDEYAEYFKERDNRHWFAEEHGWEIHGKPLQRIIGGGFEVNRDEISYLLQRDNLQLSTYVDVLNALLWDHSRRYKSAVTSDCWRVVVNIRLREQNGNSNHLGRFYLFDHGHKFTRNRRALWLDENGQLGFTTYDDHGKKVELQTNESVPEGEYFIIAVDFIASSKGCSAAVMINGRTLDYCLSSAQFKLNSKLLDRTKHLGGDLNAKHGAAFDLAEHLEWKRVLSIEERARQYAKIWSSLKNMADGSDAGARYFSESVMYYDGDEGLKILPGHKSPIWLGTGEQGQTTDFFEEWEHGT